MSDDVMQRLSEVDKQLTAISSKIQDHPNQIRNHISLMSITLAAIALVVGIASAAVYFRLSDTTTEIQQFTQGYDSKLNAIASDITQIRDRLAPIETSVQQIPKFYNLDQQISTMLERNQQILDVIEKQTNPNR